MDGNLQPINPDEPSGSLMCMHNNMLLLVCTDRGDELTDTEARHAKDAVRLLLVVVLCVCLLLLLLLLLLGVCVQAVVCMTYISVCLSVFSVCFLFGSQNENPTHRMAGLDLVGNRAFSNAVRPVSFPPSPHQHIIQAFSFICSFLCLCVCVCPCVCRSVPLRSVACMCCRWPLWTIAAAALWLRLWCRVCTDTHIQTQTQTHRLIHRYTPHSTQHLRSRHF